MARLRDFSGYLLCLLLAEMISIALGDELVTCQGFVKTSVALGTALKSIGSNIQYDSIEVALLNENGGIKERTHPSPDGYYALPLSDAVGARSLKILLPDGWVVATPVVPLDPSASKVCGAGDIDFEITGFSVWGVIPGEEGGAAGVQVTLRGEGKEIETTTDEKGRFNVDHIVAGKYEVKVKKMYTKALEGKTHNWWWSFAQDSTAVLVSKPGELSLPNFRVTGVCMWGKVLTTEGPVPNAQVALKSGEKEWTVPTDESGVFHFCDAKCGAVHEARVAHGSYIFPVRTFTPSEGQEQVEELKATEFSAHGTVVYPSGKGFAGAKIQLKGGTTLTATSAQDGKFSFPNVPIGEYTVTAALDNIRFSSVKLSPTNAAAAPIKVEGVDVCGKVVVSQSKIAVHDIRIALSEGQKQLDEKNVDSSGEFCFNVPSEAEYTVAVKVPPSLRDMGVSFFPDETTRRVVLPVLDLKFTQALVTVSGKVHCADKKCGKDVKVHMKWQGKKDIERTAVAGDDGSFTVKDVVPGVYKLSAVRSGWCWEDVGSIEVTDTDYTTASIKQSGFELPLLLRSPDELDVEILAKGGKQPVKRRLKAGEEEHLCVPTPGEYVVKPLTSQYTFPSSFTTSTQSPKEVVIDANAVTIVGEVTVEQHDQKKALKVAVDGKDLPVKLVSTDKALKTAVYSYQLEIARKDGPITSVITPSMDGIFFDPPRVDLKWDRFGSLALPSLPKIKGSAGVYISGVVKPATAGVKVVASLKGEEIQTVVTDSKGQYKIGPVKGDAVYDIDGSKKGYIITKEVVDRATVNFEAQRLSAIVVKAVDDKTQHPLPNVFLSLSMSSSAGNYRNNTHTGKDGEQEFVNLSPGTYYLRVSLKEYHFTESSFQIELKQGGIKEVTAVGKRVAYSCYGSLVNLAKRPEAGVVVEAMAETGEVEEAISNEQGQFRIRGLKPKVKYTVSVQKEKKLPKTKSATILERASPESVVVEVDGEDKTGLSFIVFKTKPSFDIRGRVDIDSEWIGKVEVHLVSSSQSVVKKVELTHTGYFEFNSVKHGSYHVKVHPRALGLKAATTGNSVPVKSTTKEGKLLSAVEVALTFNPAGQPTEDNTSSSPLVGIVMAAAVLAGIISARKQLSHGLSRILTVKLGPQQRTAVRGVTRVKTAKA